MIPRNYLEFVFFFKNTFYASGCLNYDELTHNNDSYSLGQGVRGTGKEVSKHPLSVPSLEQPTMAIPDLGAVRSWCCL